MIIKTILAMMTKNFFITKQAMRFWAIACLLVSPLSMMAEKFEVDGIRYEITDDYSVSVIPGGNYSGQVVIPSNVTFYEKSYWVRAIGEKAFHSCKDLTSIVIPNSVRSIDLHAFFLCTGLTSLEIPDGVQTIGRFAFYGSGLQSVVIGKDVQSIGTGSFSDCKDLVSVALPQKMKSVGSELFANCAGLKSVSFGSGVTSIEEGAFLNCTSLESITIPKNVNTISPRVFEGCSKLKTLTFEYSNGYNLRLKSGSYSSNRVFYGCPIVTVNLNRNITYDGEKSPFEDINSLKNVVIGDDLYSIGNNMFRGCSCLSSLSLGKRLQEIGSSAFFNCRSLTSVDFPKSLSTIKEYAFFGCSGLTSLTIGADGNEYSHGYFHVGNHAFDSCFGLKSLNIKFVSAIEDNAFRGCTAIEEIRTCAEFPPAIYSSSFDEETVRSATLHVPVPSLSDQSKYREAMYWKDFFHIVEDLPSSIHVTDINTEDAGCIYDLQGRKVTTPKKNGLYIQGGKKYIYR